MTRMQDDPSKPAPNASAAVDPAALVHVNNLLGDALGADARGLPRRDLLLEHLFALNDADGALRLGNLAALAQLMHLPAAEVIDIARSYRQFEIIADDAAAPETTVRVCTAVSCMLSGADDLLGGTRAALGASIAVRPSGCLGRCHAAPAALAGQRPVPLATPERITLAIETGAVVAPEPVPEDLPVDADMWIDPASPLKAGESIAPPFCCFTTYRARGGYALWQACLRGAHQAEALIDALEHAGLRDSVDPALPAARRWRAVRAQAAPRHLVINIAEGEPGTFKDRFLLERDPHRCLEGMLITSWVLGAQRCVVYLRDAYASQRGMLGREIARLRETFGNALPEIELRRAPEANWCATEPALFEALAGGRAAGAAAEAGLAGRPTLVSDLEAIYWVRDIIERGPQWYARHGMRGHSGLRALSVSGRVREPGLCVAPAGISLRELIEDYADGMIEGHELTAFLIGGASGDLLPASLADLPLDYGTLDSYGASIGSGAIVVLSQVDNIADVALRQVENAVADACTRCNTCREHLAEAITLMRAPHWSRRRLEEIAAAAVADAACPLGRAAVRPFLSVLRHFPNEVA